jgi:hypothetical protein
MYHVYQLEGNVFVTLSLPSPGPERKVKCFNGYFVKGHMFDTEEYGQRRKTYNNEVCVKGLTSNEFWLMLTLRS